MVLGGALLTAAVLSPNPGQTKAVTDTSLFGAPKVFDFSEFPLGDTFQVGGKTVPVGSPVNEDIDLRSTNLDYQGGSVIGNQTNALLRSRWESLFPATRGKLKRFYLQHDRLYIQPDTPLLAHELRLQRAQLLEALNGFPASAPPLAPLIREIIILS